jgi:hypothetical protein
VVAIVASLSVFHRWFQCLANPLSLVGLELAIMFLLHRPVRDISDSVSE